MAEDTKPGATAPAASAPTVSSGPVAAQTATVAPGTSAKQSMPRFGGNRAGRAREDGLAPGSKEAVEADKKKDRERKQAARDEARQLVEPAPLPSAGQGVVGGTAAQSAGLVPGVPSAPVEAFIPWRSDLLKPLTDEIIKTSEQRRVKKVCDAARQAKLAEDTAKELAKDAAFPSAGKIALEQSAPETLAIVFNKTGISAKHQHPLTCAMAMLLIWSQGQQLNQRLEQLIEATNKKSEEESKN